MNKKFITLCVSALLAGGMATPAFAELNQLTGARQNTSTTVTDKYVGYYVLKFDSRGATTWDDSWSLKADGKNNVSIVKDNAITEFNLWELKPVVVNDVENGFQLVNKAGYQLGVEDDGTIKVNGKNKTFKFANGSLALTDKGLFLAQDGETLKFVDEHDPLYDADLKAAFWTPAPNVMDASELNNKFDAAFTLGIGYYNADNEYTEYSLEGNPFAGDLKATNTDNLGSAGTYDFQQELSDGEVNLWNGDKVVVLLNNKWSSLNNSLTVGYKFALMTPTELANQEKADQALIAAGKQPVIRSYVFQVTEPNTVVETPIEVAAKIPASINKAMKAGEKVTWEELYVSEADGIYYLTVANAAEEVTASYDPTEEGLNVADYATPDYKVYVEFTQNNFVDASTFFGKAWNIVRVSDNKTIIPTGATWVDKEYVGLAVPEGQWILTDNLDGTYTWTNRETRLAETTSFAMAGLRYTDEENVYRIGNVKYSITPAENGELGGNHTEFFGADVKESSVGVDQTYKIAFTNQLTGEPAYIGRNGVGDVLLTSDPTAAISFQAKKMKTTDNDVVVTDADKNANYDVFYIINDYMKYDAAKKVWTIAKDTVSYNRYNFILDGKYLHFDSSKGFVMSDVQDAYVIKEKGGDVVNVLNLGEARKDFDDLTLYEGAQRLRDNNTTMMYFDFNFAKPKQQVDIYQWHANAQLNLDDKNYNIYRNIAPTTDTVAIYRTEYSDEFLFEKGDFLGMTYDRDGYNAALFADTAYVRNNTEKPLFMLAVRPEITPAKTYCPDHGFNTDCPAQHLDTIPGYVDADYLTSLADSAAAYAKLLDNPYLDNGKYTKLAFVGARHNVDTVTVASTGKKFTITEGLVNPMLFAFRIVNQETQDFVIETADLAKNKEEFDAKENTYVVSYVRWNNGVPVLTKDITDAEVFNVKTDLKDANPTANEEIATSSVVVAGTNGAVVVKGAEGKNVIVSTILGKVVANEVVSSDNATIAAPAGVVVVSVDGESFKVVVK